MPAKRKAVKEPVTPPVKTRIPTPPSPQVVVDNPNNKNTKHKPKRPKFRPVKNLDKIVIVTCILVASLVIYDSLRSSDEKLMHVTKQMVENQFITAYENWRSFSLPEIAIFEPEKPALLLHQNSSFTFDQQKFHPVIMVPGVVSSKLELWQGKSCSAGDFRLHYWGSTNMLKALLLNRKCWLQHIALNQTTGLDPDGIKLRPAEGLNAADFLIGDYWIWAKMIENLADIGYDRNSIYLAAYDWRLASTNLELRDSFFSKLKFQTEIFKKRNNQTVYLVGHSMGSIVINHFMKWVESKHGGNGGPNWVNDHIAGYVNIAGAILGVPKAASALLSGEMRDTAELNSVVDYIKENLVSASDLLRLFRSFGSISSMIPKGGDKIWGNATWAPDQLPTQYNFTHGELIDIVNQVEINEIANLRLLTAATAPNETSLVIEADESTGISPCSDIPEDVESIQDFATVKDLSDVNFPITSEGFLKLLNTVAPKYLKKVSDHDSWGISRNFSSANYDHPRYWNNPLESQLPIAPNMKIYSLYGIGKATERSYLYRSVEGCDSLPLRIAKNVSLESSLITSGVRMADGDGTVPLLSLGYMCVKGWKDPIYNPSNISCTTKEYQHAPDILAAGGITSRLRGGKNTGDHVDIMGNHELIADLLLIVTGNGDKVTERITSDIKKISDSINLD